MINLPPELRPAIRLLRKRKRFIVRKNLCAFDSNLCPLGQAYNIDAYPKFSELENDDQMLLRKNGWSGHMYTKFVSWFDRNYKSREYEFYDQFLAKKGRKRK